jgi:NodT family efflux transporter outer membrane factor (OMF) lipoprotein
MHKSFLLLTVLPLLAACASNKPVRAPQVTTPAAFEAQTETATVRLDRWWTAFEDAQLTTLIEEALANSPDARTAQARLVEARATRAANIYGAWPQGDLSGNASTRDSSQVSGVQGPFSSTGRSQNYSLNFDVSWEIDLFGRTRIARRAVENDFAATLFNIEGSRAALAANVADSLFSARGLAQQMEDAKSAAVIARERQRVADLLASRGLGSLADARRIAADVSQTDANIVQYEAELAAARRSLLVLLGRGTAARDSLVVAPELGAPPLPPPTVPGELLRRRPDVREAEERLAVAIAKLKIDRLALFPKFTILPGVGLNRSEQSFGNIPTVSTTFDWSAGLGLSIPVLSRPALLATARASDARTEQAVIAYEKAVQTAYGEADSSLLQLAADRSRLTLLAAGEAQARQAYDANRQLYEAGLTDLTTLLQTEQAWRAARTASTAARTQALRRSVQTFKALGGGWTLPGDPSA